MKLFEINVWEKQVWNLLLYFDRVTQRERDNNVAQTVRGEVSKEREKNSDTLSQYFRQWKPLVAGVKILQTKLKHIKLIYSNFSFSATTQETNVTSCYFSQGSSFLFSPQWPPALFSCPLMAYSSSSQVRYEWNSQ